MLHQLSSIRLKRALSPHVFPALFPFLNGVTSPTGRKGETCVLSGWWPCDRREALRQRAEYSESMEVEEFLSGRIFHFVSFRLEDLGWVVRVLISLLLPLSLSPFLFTLPSQSSGAMWLCPMQLRGCGGGGLGDGLRILEVVVVVC